MGRNVLFVSTRQWNPGDEFIRMGVENAYRHAGLPIGIAALYNRNPQVRSMLPSFDGLADGGGILGQAKSVVHSPLGRFLHIENSVSDRDDLEIFDEVVFCGTPEWVGGRVDPLLKKLESFGGRVLFLGIGMPNRRIRLSPSLKALLTRSTVLVRDDSLFGRFREEGVPARLVPCPALLSVPLGDESSRSAPESNGDLEIGFVFTAAGTTVNQAVREEVQALQLRLIEALRKKGRLRVICHYWKDVVRAKALLPTDGIDISYAWSAENLLDCFRGCDIVVSSRVHGCGAASSLLIPNAVIGHDARAGTTAGFLSRTLDEDRASDVVQELIEDRERIGDRLAAHKREVLDTYADVLRS